jgi:Spy/CpxP family protein refolding chaperone
MTRNQNILATIVATQAVQKASRAHLPSPQARVMDALQDAIDSKRNELQRLIVSGNFDTETYRTAKAQLATWTEAWNSNR